MSRSEQFGRVLAELKRRSPGVVGSALISVDGLLLASAFGAKADEQALVTSGAAILGLADHAARVLDSGTIERVLIHGQNGIIAVLSVTDTILLLAITDPQAKLGLALLDIEEAAKEIRRIMS